MESSNVNQGEKGRFPGFLGEMRPPPSILGAYRQAATDWDAEAAVLEDRQCFAPVQLRLWRMEQETKSLTEARGLRRLADWHRAYADTTGSALERESRLRFADYLDRLAAEKGAESHHADDPRLAH